MMPRRPNRHSRGPQGSRSTRSWSRSISFTAEVVMVVWFGTVPEKCDLCNTPITDTFIDGRVFHLGSWAIMCPACYKLRGTGLGTGIGQKYELAFSATGPIFVKVEG